MTHSLALADELPAASPPSAAERAAAEFLIALGVDLDDESRRDTPRRMAAMYAELLTPADFHATTFPNDGGYDELVVARDIPFHSLCEHHLLPFSGVAHVGYILGERIVGLSKLARVVDHFARALQVQERLTTQVAGWLDEHLSPQGVGVVLLPRLADATSRTRAVRRAVGVVAALGAALTLGAALLGSRAIALIGGSAYGAGLGGAVWLFALLGTLLAVAQLLLYSGIAAADGVAVVAVWSAAVAECVAVEVLAATGRLSMLSLAASAAVAATLLVGAGLARLRTR